MNRTIKLLITGVFTILSGYAFAQDGVLISDQTESTPPTDPDGSAVLHMSSTARGVLVPRMNSTQRTTISNPAKGLLVYDITTNSFWFNEGTASSPVWVELGSGGGSGSLSCLTHTNDQYTSFCVDVGLNGTYNTLKYSTNLSTPFVVTTENSNYLSMGSDGEAYNVLLGGGDYNRITSGVQNTAVIGGTGLVGRTSNTVYVPRIGFNNPATTNSATPFEGLLASHTLTADQTWNLPNKSGTVALLSDISIPSMVWTSGSAGTESIRANNSTTTDATGNYAVAEGYNTLASGHFGAHAEGQSTKATNYGTHAEGRNSTASGLYSHAEGDNSKAMGHSSHAEGNSTTASGARSHAEGQNTTASGNDSHAEGAAGTTASGSMAHAEGSNTKATSTASHSEGSGTEAVQVYAHAEGIATKVTGAAGHSGGYGISTAKVLAAGRSSFNHSSNSVSQTNGYGALADYSAILGGQDHNIVSTALNSVILGGVGLVATNSNTVYVRNLEVQAGEGHFTNGDLHFDTNGTGVVLTSPNGSKYRLVVDDSGNLSTVLVP